MTGRAFPRYAWTFLGYLIAVILFGAWVRITHSGAGCGSHWPSCNGVIVPLAPSLETTIEFTHRVTSGLCGIFGLILVGWAGRRFGVASPVFKASVLTLLFIIFEGAIGAGLVLGELVEDDDSVARALVISLHLTNTLLLTGSAAMAAWLSSGPSRRAVGAMPSVGWQAAGLAALVLISMSGAITALGDTLFPIEPALGPGLLDKIRADLSPANHFLVRLRVGHPFLAVAGSLLVLTLLWPPARAGSRPARWAAAAIVAELLIGLWNVAWAAPGGLQLLHLLFAQIVWVATLLTFAPSWRLVAIEQRPPLRTASETA